MTLSKRYKRNIKSNLSFYVGVIILTLLVVSVYLVVNGGVESEKAYIDDMMENCNVEQSQFTVYMPMSDEDIEYFKNQYDMEIELQKTADLKVTDDSGKKDTVRFLRSMKQIDKYKVTEGEDLSDPEDILLNTNYALKNNYEIGDSIKVENKTYHVSGYFERPDYLLVLNSLSDSLSTPETFGLAVVGDEQFDSVPQEDVSSYYVAVFHKNNEKEFRKELYDKHLTAGYVRDEVNLRISTATTMIEQYQSSMDLILPMLLLFVVIIVAVVLGRKIKSEKKYIGVLTALGYRRGQLARNYSIFGIIPGFVGSILGIAVSMPLAAQMTPQLFSKIEPLPLEFSVDFHKVLLVLFLPAVVYFVSVYVVAYRIMKDDVVNMINGTLAKEGKTRFRMENSKWSFRKKFILRSTLGKFSRVFVLILGVVIGSLLLVYSYAIVDSLHTYINESVDRIGDFKYEYYLNSLRTDAPEAGSVLLSANCDVKGSDDSVTIMGMNDNDYIRLETKEGSSVDLKEDHYYMTSMASLMFDVSEGDELTVYDTASLKEHTITIDKIVYNDSQAIIYSTQQTISEMMNLPTDSYNVVVSDKKLSYTDSEIAKTVTRDSFKEQIGTMEEMMQSMSYMLLPFGMLICIITIYLMVNVLITENRPSISMLKVLGYRKKEINRIMTHVYTYILPIGIVLGIVAGFYMTKMNFYMNVSAYNTYIETCLTPVSIAKVVAVIVISYVISLLLLNRKVDKVNMVESLKDNRE